MTFFITCLPQDKYGNHGYSANWVIEVEPFQDGQWEHWRVLAPVDFAEHWPTKSPRAFPWVQVPGPARTLTDQEYVALLEEVGVQQPYLDWARKRLEP